MKSSSQGAATGARAPAGLASPADAQGKKKRVRLSPELRRQQILDAALVEFSAEGFAGASVSKIARRAGMSKANIFVHFTSKDEIFETLLKDLLDPAKGQWDLPAMDQAIDKQIDDFVDRKYDDLTPEVIAIIRLLISEGHRVPELIGRWYSNTVLPAHAKRQDIIQGYVDAGIVKRSTLTENFEFAMAPIMFAAIFKVMLPEPLAEAEFEKVREVHRKLLHALLIPT
ncbi:Transcriptional regulator, TetR family [plant metagenome]|uniref:Transcriptional regulator, TetR family n=1 Tax=plant metagenome TaxID=1297885 RepID=A0A484R5G6_9ZZZZ